MEKVSLKQDITRATLLQDCPSDNSLAVPLPTIPPRWGSETSVGRWGEKETKPWGRRERERRHWPLASSWSGGVHVCTGAQLRQGGKSQLWKTVEISLFRGTGCYPCSSELVSWGTGLTWGLFAWAMTDNKGSGACHIPPVADRTWREHESRSGGPVSPPHQHDGNKWHSHLQIGKVEHGRSDPRDQGSVLDKEMSGRSLGWWDCSQRSLKDSICFPCEISLKSEPRNLHIYLGPWYLHSCLLCLILFSLCLKTLHILCIIQPLSILPFWAKMVHSSSLCLS